MWPTISFLHLNRARDRTRDVGEFTGLIQQAAARVKLKTVLADAGYDSEANQVSGAQEFAIGSDLLYAKLLAGQDCDKRWDIQKVDN